MLSGSADSETAASHARELLEQAIREREGFARMPKAYRETAARRTGRAKANVDRGTAPVGR